MRSAPKKPPELTVLRVVLAAFWALGLGGVSVEPGSAQQTDPAHYLQVMSAAFGVSVSEGQRLAGEGVPLEALPVVLFLARETGLAPSAILALRRSGASWSALAIRSGVSFDRIVVELPEGVGSPHARSLAARLRATPRETWNTLQFDDDDVVFFVHVRGLTRHLELPVSRVVEATTPADSWVAAVRRLTPPRSEP
jgi:hypothetical protein